MQTIKEIEISKNIKALLVQTNDDASIYTLSTHSTNKKTWHSLTYKNQLYYYDGFLTQYYLDTL